MRARLLLFVVRRRLNGRRLALVVGVTLALAFGATWAGHAAAPRYTLTVVDFDLNPSAGNSVFIYAADRQIAQANVFNGTLQADGSAHFRLPSGDYVVYVTRGMLDTRAQPSGPLRSASVAIQLRRDVRVDFLRQVRADAGGN